MRASIVAASLLALPSAALAQRAGTAAARPPKWAVDFLVGGAPGSVSSGGTAGDYPTGTAFDTAGSRPSRAVSSWYSGDGAALFNDMIAQFSTVQGSRFATITPIDGVLRENAATRQSSLVFGARLARQLSSRLAIEFAGDVRPSSIELTGAVQDGLAVSRDSFKAAFDQLLATAPLSQLVVNSTLNTTAAKGRRTQLTGELAFNVVDFGPATLYVAGGGGVVRDTSSVTATLTGNYSFLLLNTYRMNETDVTTVKVSAPDIAALGLVGGGLRWNVSAKTGLRFDVRAGFWPGGTTTVVRGTPAAVTASPAGALPTLTTPSVQFSNNQGTARSSLSGTPTDVTAFSGGLERNVTVTVGIVRRF